MALTPQLRNAIQQDEALWVAHFTQLYRQCHAGTGGRGLDDLDHLATIATAAVKRLPRACQPDVSHFEHTPARQAFIAEICQRQIRAYFSENCDADLFGRNDFTWAFLQVADMGKLAAWNRGISEDKEAIPGILSQAETVAQTIASQFKFCKLHEEHLGTATASTPANPANNGQSSTAAADLDNSVDDGMDDEDYQLQVKQEIKTEDTESDEEHAPSSQHSHSTRYMSGEI